MTNGYITHGETTTRREKNSGLSLVLKLNYNFSEKETTAKRGVAGGLPLQIRVKI
jgi:hypothetical protein